jgi:hypothetical protein
MSGIWVVLILALVVLEIASVWKIFTKAGQPGWASIIPIYNIIVWLRIAGRPTWWIVLFIIPFVNIIAEIIVLLDIAKAFGKSGRFVVGMIFLSFIFFPILGFGDAQYRGPAVPSGGDQPRIQPAV